MRDLKPLILRNYKKANWFQISIVFILFAIFLKLLTVNSSYIDCTKDYMKLYGDKMMKEISAKSAFSECNGKTELNTSDISRTLGEIHLSIDQLRRSLN